MRVGIVSTTLGNPWAGSEELWYQTSLVLLKNGVQVRASVFKPGKFCKQHENFKGHGGILDYRRKFRNGRLHQLRNKFLSNYRKLFRWRPDLLLLSLGSVDDLMMHQDLKRELQKSNTKIIPICLYNADNICYSSYVREELVYYYNHSKYSVFVSNHNKELLERQLAVRLRRAYVFSSPTSYGMDQHQKLPIPSMKGTIKFACVARFSANIKGYDILLKSFSPEKWRNRNFHLNIYGIGEDEAYILQLIALYGLEDRVSLKGFVENTREIWKENHFNVMASRAEGLSLAILEAMICGRIPIVTDVGDNGYIIEDGVSGFLAEAPMPKYFERALERAWDNLENYDNISKRAVETASAVFRENPIDKMIGIIRKTYEQR